MNKSSMYLLILFLLFFSSSNAGAKKTKKQTTKIASPKATITPSVTPVPTIDPSDYVQPSDSGKSTKSKSFNWYFQHGPACPHCQKLARQRQAAEEQRENLFRP